MTEQEKFPFKVDVLHFGFSGKLTTGGLGWSSTALIRHGGHNILVDTGGLLVRKTIEGLLDQCGVKPQDIDMILITHLHNDHAGNLDLFPRATLVFSNADWEHANSLLHFDHDSPESVLHLLRHGDKKLLLKDGEEIIPGITAMFTPGHTPGCVSYVVDQGGEKWVFSGDAAKNRGELTSGKVQMTLNLQDSLQSIQKIIKTADRVLPGHDGWVTIRDGKAIPEGGNDVTFVFGEGVTVNGGLTEVTIKMD